MSKHLQVELERIKSDLLTISSLVERNLTISVQAIREVDPSVAQKIYGYDDDVDRMEVDLEEECLKVLELHQPLAGDLRFVVAALKINSDLERMGDLAVNLAQRASYLSKLPKVAIPFDFDTMAAQVRSMVKMAIKALIELDSMLAHQVIKDDDLVDRIHREMYARVFANVKADPENAEQHIHYLTVSRFLERIADIATNVAEDIVYMVDGTIIRHDRNSLS